MKTPLLIALVLCVCFTDAFNDRRPVLPTSVAPLIPNKDAMEIARQTNANLALRGGAVLGALTPTIVLLFSHPSLLPALVALQSQDAFPRPLFKDVFLFFQAGLEERFRSSIGVTSHGVKRSILSDLAFAVCD